MKVVLISAPIMDYRGHAPNRRLGSIAQDRLRECPAYGIYMLASVLRQAGHEVVVADLIALGSHNIAYYGGDIDDCSLVGIGATSLSWPTASTVIRQVRRMRPDVPIVLGGIHPTMFDRYLLSYFPVQYVVRGEGEIALLTLCNCIEAKKDVSEVPNLSWVDANGNIIRNAVGTKISASDLSKFPLPDYGALPSGIYKGLSIESSRGCAFDCSFCSTSYRLGWRGFPPERFVDRLEDVMQHVNRTLLANVHIVDDEFSMNPRRATEIAQIIRRRNLHPKLVYDSRATDLLWDGYVENIKEFTCQFLVGAECGYDEGLKRIGKGTTCEILEKAAQKLEHHNLSKRADFSFILGLPWESKAEVEKTIRFAVHLYSTYGVRILLQWYCQIPGSRLWQADRKRGVVTEAMYNDFGFFRDLYLFLSGVHLTPADVWDIGELVDKLKVLAGVHNSDRKMIEFAFPISIYQNFPRESLQDTDTGLVSLRQVSRPEQANQTNLPPMGTGPFTPAQIGIPMRHSEDGD